MTDIIERLRKWAEEYHNADIDEGADEIERLRDDLDISEENFKTQMEVHYKDRERIAKLQAVVDAQREYHERNLHDARAYRADPSHRCDWRVRIEAIESRSRAALAALEQGND